MVTVYTPGGIIHTNNYQVCTVLVLSECLINTFRDEVIRYAMYYLQKGTWRVMLSEGTVSEYKLIKHGNPFGFNIAFSA